MGEGPLDNVQGRSAGSVAEEDGLRVVERSAAVAKVELAVRGGEGEAVADHDRAAVEASAPIDNKKRITCFKRGTKVLKVRAYWWTVPACRFFLEKVMMLSGYSLVSSSSPTDFALMASKDSPAPQTGWREYDGQIREQIIVR